MDTPLDYKEVENKLLIMYLINRMELSMSGAQITDFVIAKDLMNHFMLAQTLADMVEQDYLYTKHESAADANTTRYSVTNAGMECLELFMSRIPRHMRTLINQYVEDNHGKVKKDFEVTATYFVNEDADEYSVKCVALEDKRALMELVISIETIEQAKLIHKNWRANASTIYKKIIDALIFPEE